MEKAKKMSKNCYELVSGKLQEQHILMLHLQCSAEVWNQWGHLSHQPQFSGDIFKISETMAFFFSYFTTSLYVANLRMTGKRSGSEIIVVFARQTLMLVVFDTKFTIPKP